jgi:glycopeptide antibiotics resistance protein
MICRFSMNAFFKKFLVILPVAVLGVVYLHDHYETYAHVRSKRLLFLALTILLLYGWIFLEVSLRKQRNFFRIGLQASFYVYVFMVLTLTGFFILFREVSASDWWHKMMVRIDKKDHVNFQLFKMFRIYKLSNKQIVGNFVMLLPLGLYLPLLYKKISNFFVVALVSFLVSSMIELLQLVTSYRSADVDDVLLNTLGACLGFIIYKIIQSGARWRPRAQKQVSGLANKPLA